MSMFSGIRPVVVLLLGSAAIAAGATTIAAQSRYEPGRLDQPTAYRDYDLPAFVSVADGFVELERDGQTSRDIENVPLEAGDLLRTTRGRAEVLFEDGSLIALDEHTIVAFISDSEIELLDGRVRTQWQNRAGAADMTVHTRAGRATLLARGDYRITLSRARQGEEIEVAVTRGSAELANDLGRTIVREGTRALTTATYAPSVPYAFSAPRDDFERWTEGLEADRYGVESARYLPTELRYYGGTFDRYGSWQHHHSHGWVWYPRVSVGWRPYNGGRWSFVVGFGYSWVGGSRWAWPTHHYGRWDHVGGRYFWIPSKPVHRRVVGYAAPRPSYSVSVAWYQRPARTVQSWGRPSASPNRGPQSSGRPPQAAPPPTRSSQTRAPQAAPPRGPSRQTPTAIPRNQPSSARGQSSAPPRNTRPAPEARAPQSPRPESAPPPRSGVRSPRSEPSSPPSTSSRSRPSAPPPAASAPPSGSRTPSRSAAPRSGSGGGGNSGSGTAVRRRGGG